MAIREEHDFLSENERKFLFDSIHDAPHVRADGRELMHQRKVRDLTQSGLLGTRAKCCHDGCLMLMDCFFVLLRFAVDPRAIPSNGGAESSRSAARTNAVRCVLVACLPRGYVRK
jgi:hypothetical protein